TRDGTEAELPPARILVTASGGRVRYTSRGRPASEWGIALDAGKNPKHIDFRGADGKVLRGIYRRDGDRWTVCCATRADGKRPTAFTTGKGRTLEVLHRKKP